MMNLGAAFGRVWRANEQAIQLMADISEDMAAFHAPSECATLAYGGVDRVVLDAIAEVEGETGMTWDALLAEVRKRTGGRWLAWSLYQSVIPLSTQEVA
jgi:hypothetical protein